MQCNIDEQGARLRLTWGIMVLLGFIFAVLGAIASFMVFLGRRSAALARAAQASSPV